MMKFSTWDVQINGWAEFKWHRRTKWTGSPVHSVESIIMFALGRCYLFLECVQHAHKEWSAFCTQPLPETCNWRCTFAFHHQAHTKAHAVREGACCDEKIRISGHIHSSASESKEMQHHRIIRICLSDPRFENTWSQCFSVFCYHLPGRESHRYFKFFGGELEQIMRTNL